MHKEPAIPRHLDVEAHLFARVLSRLARSCKTNSRLAAGVTPSSRGRSAFRRKLWRGFWHSIFPYQRQFR